MKVNGRLATCLVKLLPVLVVAILLLAVSTPAQADTNCFTNLGYCFHRAAGVDGFWWRWASGLDCELSFFGCLRAVFAF